MCILDFNGDTCNSHYVLLQEGDLEQVKSLSEHFKGLVDFKSDINGDTPLIAAARAGHSEVRLLSSIAVVAVYSQECNGHVHVE